MGLVSQVVSESRNEACITIHASGRLEEAFLSNYGGMVTPASGAQQYAQNWVGSSSVELCRHEISDLFDEKGHISTERKIILLFRDKRIK